MQRPPWPFPDFTRNEKQRVQSQQRQDRPRAALRMPKPGGKNEELALQALAKLQELQKRGAV